MVDGIRAAVGPFAEVIRTPDDVGNAQRLRALKVDALTFAAQESAFKVSAACFAENRPFQDKVRAWKAKVEKGLDVAPQACGEK